MPLSRKQLTGRPFDATKFVMLRAPSAPNSGVAVTTSSPSAFSASAPPSAAAAYARATAAASASASAAWSSTARAVFSSALVDHAPDADAAAAAKNFTSCARASSGAAAPSKSEPARLKRKANAIFTPCSALSVVNRRATSSDARARRTAGSSCGASPPCASATARADVSTTAKRTGYIASKSASTVWSAPRPASVAGSRTSRHVYRLRPSWCSCHDGYMSWRRLRGQRRYCGSRSRLLKYETAPREPESTSIRTLPPSSSPRACALAPPRCASLSSASDAAAGSASDASRESAAASVRASLRSVNTENVLLSASIVSPFR